MYYSLDGFCPARALFPSPFFLFLRVPYTLRNPLKNKIGCSLEQPRKGEMSIPFLRVLYIYATR